MEVTIKTCTEAQLKSRDWRDKISVEIDGKNVFDVFDGEPEDNTLSRNFNSCHSIGALLEDAYICSRDGEWLNLIRRNFNEDME